MGYFHLPITQNRNSGRRANNAMVFALLLIVISIETNSVASEPSIRVPKTILAGDPFSIRVEGLPPRILVRLSATRMYGKEPAKRFEAEAIFRSDSLGSVDTATQSPVGRHGNSYTGIEPIGLLWSMAAAPNEADPRPEKDMVRWSVRKLDAEAVEIATATTELVERTGELEESVLSDDVALQGTFVVRRKGNERLPVIILLGGSEGDDFGARSLASGLASRGFAAVGVPYYSPTYGTKKPQFAELPSSFIDIPVDRLEAVRQAIVGRGDFDPARIGILGVSKGAEFALLAGSHFDWIEAICAIVPSDVVWEGWGDQISGPRSGFSWHGKSLPYVPYDGMRTAIERMQAGQPATIREPHDAGRIKYADHVQKARIRVEDIESAVMLVGGDQDNVWNSGEMARNIVRMRLRAGMTTEAWISPLAGHYLSGHAHRPLESAEGSLRSRTYPAMIDFFRRNLASASND